MQYVLIKSDVSDEVVGRLKKLGLDLKVYGFNPVLTLADVDFRERNWGDWRTCDNFKKGLEWEDYRIKPKTPQEAQEGNLSARGNSNRGWTKFECTAYQRKDNPKGIITSVSWIHCVVCEHYSPRTLEGRRDVLAAIKGQYQKELGKIDAEIGQVDDLLQGLRC